MCLFVYFVRGLYILYVYKKKFNKQNCFYCYVKFVGIFPNKFKHLYTTPQCLNRHDHNHQLQQASNNTGGCQGRIMVNQVFIFK